MAEPYPTELAVSYVTCVDMAMDVRQVEPRAGRALHWAEKENDVFWRFCETDHLDTFKGWRQCPSLEKPFVTG